MNKDNSDKLLKTFPSLYPNYDPLYPVGPNNNEFDLAIGDGWFDLIWRLSEKLEPLCKKSHLAAITNRLLVGERDAARIYAVQVKEKFGTLRFYMSFSTQEMDKDISEAEDESERTCETCGKPGALRDDLSWLKTLCEEDYQKALQDGARRRKAQ